MQINHICSLAFHITDMTLAASLDKPSIALQNQNPHKTKLKKKHDNQPILNKRDIYLFTNDMSTPSQNNTLNTIAQTLNTTRTIHFLLARFRLPTLLLFLLLLRPRARAFLVRTPSRENDGHEFLEGRQGVRRVLGAALQGLGRRHETGRSGFGCE
jgi:hypothetical protein